MTDSRYPSFSSRAPAGYSAIPPTYVTNDTRGDEQLARELQHQFDQEARQQQQQQQQNAPTQQQQFTPAPNAPGFAPNRSGMQVIADPVQMTERPFRCGSCQTTHLVRNALPNSQFVCRACGATNRVLIQDERPVVVVQRGGSWVPVPIICSLM